MWSPAYQPSRCQDQCSGANVLIDANVVYIVWKFQLVFTDATSMNVTAICSVRRRDVETVLVVDA